MKKRTPGPWHVSEPFHDTSDRPGTYIIKDSNYCKVGEVTISKDRGIENARLIAAAPEMLEFLQSYLESYPSWGSAQYYTKRVALKALIARIEGRE